tara:strand:- start:117 stop:275 length:159 start_codon:yes stop_codon:yes gene_type:complete
LEWLVEAWGLAALVQGQVLVQGQGQGQVGGVRAIELHLESTSHHPKPTYHRG